MKSVLILILSACAVLAQPSLNGPEAGVFKAAASTGGASCQASPFLENAVSNDNGDVGTTARYYVGQAYTPGSTVQICKWAWQCITSGGNVSAKTYQTEIYAYSATALGTAIATSSDTIAGSAFSASAAWFTNSFSTPVTLTSGTAYVIVLRPVQAADDVNFAGMMRQDSDVITGDLVIYSSNKSILGENSAVDVTLRAFQFQ